MVNNFNAYGVVYLRIKKKFSRGKEFIGIVESQYIDRRFAHPRNLQCALVERANFPIPAPGAFRKDEEIAPCLEIRAHCFHLFDHQPGKAPFT